MVALKNKLVVLGGIGFLVAACTVTSTTTNTGDGGSSSGTSGTSSGTSGTSGDGGSSSGTSGTSSGTSGTSGSSGDAGCSPHEVTISNSPTCNTCAHTNCQAPLDACFKDVSATGCECQAFNDCSKTCVNPDAAAENDCLQTCATVHGQAAGQLWLDWNKCILDKCGPEGGTGDCQ